MLDRSELDAPALSVRGLVYERGGERLLDIPALDLAAGGLTAVLGPNGAGKSVLLRLLHGLIAPTAGQVLYGGRPLDAATRRRQAMVFQRPVLLRRSAAANIDYALRLRGRVDRARRDALLADVGLAELGRRPARRLSGGEQQRLALARALATEPETLFLDEPTASLDPASTETIERLTSAARSRGVKIVLVTHNLAQARRLADDVLMLRQGRVAEQTRAATFFAGPRSAAGRAHLAGDIVR